MYVYFYYTCFQVYIILFLLKIRIRFRLRFIRIKKQIVDLDMCILYNTHLRFMYVLRITLAPDP